MYVFFLKELFNLLFLFIYFSDYCRIYSIPRRRGYRPMNPAIELLFIQEYKKDWECCKWFTKNLSNYSNLMRCETNKKRLKPYCLILILLSFYFSLKSNYLYIYMLIIN